MPVAKKTKTTAKKTQVKQKPQKLKSQAPAEVIAGSAQIISDLPVNKIVPSLRNPRKVFDDQSLAELVVSVKEKGILQPIIVRPKDDGYEIIAGERRWRAAEMAGFETIPTIIRELSDDEAFDVMTVENLMREDLTEAEEARSFKAFVDAKGPTAIEDLAQRSGISARYIRRRVRVMELPEAVLKEWEEGKIDFAVLEQLLRLDPGTVEEFYKKYMKQEWQRSIGQVKDRIDGMMIPLGRALFKMTDAGCASCPANSKVQGSLFGDDFAEKKVNCLNPSCFVKKQRTFLTENWSKTKYAEDYGTNGFRFQEEVDYDEYILFYTGKPWKECKDCPSFVSLIYRRGEVCHQKACINTACYKSKARGENKGKEKKPAKRHGPEFQDRFYRERIPQLASPLPFDDERILRIVARTLLDASSVCTEEFKTTHNIESSWYTDKAKIWLALETVSREDLILWIRKVALHLTLEHVQLGNEMPMKHAVAKHFGVALAQDWTLNQEYLQRKTVPEILGICEEFKIFEDPKAKAYAAATLGLRTEKYSNLKKKDLIKIILESGVDLNGKVPKEIQTTE